MGKKIAGIVLISILALYVAIVVMIQVFRVPVGIEATMLISEGAIVLPALAVYLFIAKKISFANAFGFKKIKVSTAFAVIGFGLLIMPLGTLMNTISMLVVDNVFVKSTDVMLAMNPVVLFVIMAIYGPLCEELAFRGVILKSLDFEQSGWKAIVVSGLVFGLMHMNLNQFMYAFVLGMAFAMIVEATGSIWPSIICHMLFNGLNVAMVLVINKLMPGYYESEAVVNAMSKSALLQSLGIYLNVAAVTTTMAMFLLKWIAEREDNPDFFRKLKGNKKSVMTPLLILAIVLYVAYIGFDTYTVINNM